MDIEKERKELLNIIKKNTSKDTLNSINSIEKVNSQNQNSFYELETEAK